jgi:hypothetical protein
MLRENCYLEFIKVYVRKFIKGYVRKRSRPIVIFFYFGNMKSMEGLSCMKLH